MGHDYVESEDPRTELERSNMPKRTARRVEEHKRQSAGVRFWAVFVLFLCCFVLFLYCLCGLSKTHLGKERQKKKDTWLGDACFVRVFVLKRE